MPEKQSLSQRWQEYRPSKAAWAWTGVACIVLTMIVGFTIGGWVTGGTARTMAEQAAQDARENVVASLCVDKFVSSANAANELQTLKEASTWEQDNFIEEGGWIQFEGLDEQVTGAADVCADRLVAMEGLPESAVESEASTDGTNEASADGTDEASTDGTNDEAADTPEDDSATTDG